MNIKIKSIKKLQTPNGACFKIKYISENNTEIYDTIFESSLRFKYFLSSLGIDKVNLLEVIGKEVSVITAEKSIITKSGNPILYTVVDSYLINNKGGRYE